MQATGSLHGVYAPSAYYAYDGPIYGYNGLAPDRVIVDVQSQLQRTVITMDRWMDYLGQ